MRRSDADVRTGGSAAGMIDQPLRDPALVTILEQVSFDRLVNLCKRYLGGIEEAEDAAQEVLLKLLNMPEPPQLPRAWIYRVAINHCNSIRRRRRFDNGRRPLPRASWLAEACTSIGSRLDRAGRVDQVLRVLGRMPPKYEQPLHLRYGEGLSRREVAEALGIPESIVKSRIVHGLVMLREAIHAGA